MVLALQIIQGSQEVYRIRRERSYLFRLICETPYGAPQIYTEQINQFLTNMGALRSCADLYGTDKCVPYEYGAAQIYTEQINQFPTNMGAFRK